MIQEIKFALYAIKKNIQSSAELRTSFLLNVFGMCVNNASFIIVWVFFVKSVGVIGGWTAADIIGLLGFSTFCFGMIIACAFGIRKMPDAVSSGAFDRFMLSPKNLLVRVATSNFGVQALGDILFGVTCLVIYAVLIHASLLQIGLTLFLMILTTVMFWSMTVVVCSIGFFFTDASATSTSLFELFFAPSVFHGGIFTGATRFIFTFLVPSLVVGGLPVEIVRDLSLNKLIIVTILTIIWFILSIKIFNTAVKRYESTNFMTFGQ